MPSTDWTQTIFNWLGFARHRATPTTVADGELGELGIDSKGRLRVRVEETGYDPSSTLAPSLSRKGSAGLEYKRAVRSGAGKLTKIRGFNGHATTAYYLQIFDSVTDPPTDNTIPKESIYVPALTNFSLDIPEGIDFANGIFVAASSTGDKLTIATGATFWFVAEHRAS